MLISSLPLQYATVLQQLTKEAQIKMREGQAVDEVLADGKASEWRSSLIGGLVTRHIRKHKLIDVKTSTGTSVIF